MNEDETIPMKDTKGTEVKIHLKTKMGKDSSSMKNSNSGKSSPNNLKNRYVRVESPQHPKKERRRCEPDSERFYVNCNVLGDSSTSNEDTNFRRVSFR